MNKCYARRAMLVCWGEDGENGVRSPGTSELVVNVV